MNVNFKPLGLAAAVAAVTTAGYAGVSSAANISSTGLGDLAIIPYYTVRDDWGTGMHIINTSDETQVVKLRFRRASDSLDALDLNLVMSPRDEWTGFLNDTDGTIRLTTQDTTCTAPLPENGGFSMPAIYREGADEGYIEVIAMGQTTTETQPVAVNAEHDDGVPENCAYVEENFLNGFLSLKNGDKLGVTNPNQTWGSIDDSDGDELTEQPSMFEDAGNVLKVSWFIRDAGTGIEFGNDASHLENFGDEAMITNQEFGVFAGDLTGFDFPDLNGTAPGDGLAALGNTATWNNVTGSGKDKYNELRASYGVVSVLNDWSDNPDLSVGTDWVITMPGQYVMLDIPEYLTADEDFPCESALTGTDGCDKRDIPVTAQFAIWDREEDLLTVEGDRGVVVSPSIPGVVPTTQLKYEVNVIHWAPEREVLASEYDISVDTSLLDAVSGWAELKVTSKKSAGLAGSATQDICLWNVPGYDPIIDDPNDLMSCVTPVQGDVPMVGFVAWERSFAENPDGNYGRAVAHSFTSS